VDLRDVDLKDFFRLIQEISGQNVVLDPNVRGTLTILLDDVPWDQALDIVLKNNNLTQQRDGNVLRIATLETLRHDANSHTAEPEALAVEKLTVNRSLSGAPAKDVIPTEKTLLSQQKYILATDDTGKTVLVVLPGDAAWQFSQRSAGLHYAHMSGDVALLNNPLASANLQGYSMRLIGPSGQALSGSVLRTQIPVFKSLNSEYAPDAPSLTLKVSRSGGAHLTLGGDVATEERPIGLSNTGDCDLNDPKTGLIVKLIKSGGAHLTVTTTPIITSIKENCGYH
jgi:hypothetical protein